MKVLKEVALYIHIPFCVKKCNYCDFLSFYSDDDTKRVYLNALYKEAVYWKKMIDGRYRVKTVFVGGGTPTSLSVEQLKLLDDIIKLFEIDGAVEFTIEANPGTVDKDKAIYLYKMGINRVSIGLQSSIDSELKALGRIHTFDEFLQSYHTLRDAGFENINIDIMSDIPKQSFESYKKTLENVVSLKPEHISSYSLIIEPGTVFYDMYKEGKLDIADEETDRQMYYHTRDFLLENGYERYEISNYALKGKECKHNLVYWNLGDYIGMGLGASSYFEGARFSNYSDMKSYLNMVDMERNSIETGCKEYEKLTENAKIEEFMFVGLRKYSGVSKKEFKKRFNHDIDEIYGDIISKFIKNKLLSENDNSDRIYLTNKGIDVSNYVLSEFLL